MADLDKIAAVVSDGITTTLGRVKALILGVAVVALVIGAATFATGLWAFESARLGWVVVGGVICLIPVGAALLGWFLVNTTARTAPRLLGDIKTLIEDSTDAAAVLIDHDTGQRLATSAKTFQQLKADLKTRRQELPALFAGVRAITSVPGLAAITVLGITFVGGLGFILLIGKLLS
jgi:hypothetical protein